MKKLQPTQWIGLATIVVFGGGMILRLTQPSEREIMEQRLAALPRIEVPAPEFPVPDLSGIQTAPVAPPAPGAGAADVSLMAPEGPDLTAMGSQAAKDDLYCAALLGEEFDARIKTDHPDTVVPLMDMQSRLDTAGIAKLKADGVTDGSNWAGITLAYGEKVKTDLAAGAAQLTVAVCKTRANGLPPGELY
jgi:hypothetical protein